jgi:hypothetical protein
MPLTVDQAKKAVTKDDAEYAGLGDVDAGYYAFTIPASIQY